jgi:imidazolonepropionase-like amidohydrolase
MRSAGLKIGFGTDLLGSQQDRQGTEFGLRAQIFSALEILQQATSINAELLRLEDKVGRVAPGFEADLIVVDGDPLADVTILGDAANIPAIMQGGRFHKRAL